ncbi:MAG TPA: hypothetical protein VFK04_09620 [Gemmatimonadaceae bacterium]|nr:hypothetical protein [Gemmatimonadaceae bacterium]
MRLSIITRAVLAAAVAAALAAPVPAHAQFGKLLKKAKEKVAGGSDSAAAAAGGSGATSSGSLLAGSPKFDETVIELTPSVIDRMLGGMAAEARVKQASIARQKKIEADMAAVEKETDQLEAQHPSSERDAWQETTNKIDECISNDIAERQEQNEGQMQARLMSDPATRQKMMELSQKMSAEMQRGDSVAAKKTMAEVQALTYPSMKEDSAAAMKKCGKLAPKPAWMDREDQLRERRNQLGNELRDAGSAARDTALAVVAHGGGGGGAQLTAVQYSMALERMIAWAAATAPGAKGSGKMNFSATELDALKAKESEVRSATAELRELNVWR